MKYLRFFAVAVASCLLGLSVARAQNYEPMDTWPYLVQDFVKGDIRMTNGNVLKSKEVNFNIIDGKLHYIENGVIMSAEMVQVSSVVTESATYLNVWGRMMKVVASDEKGYVLRSVEADKDKMAKRKSISDDGNTLSENKFGYFACHEKRCIIFVICG